MTISKIPYDFIVDAQFFKNGAIVAKYDRKLQERFAIVQGRSFFYKSRHVDESTPVPLPPLEDGVTPMQDFARRTEALRVMITKMYAPRLQEYFRQNCHILILKEFGDKGPYNDCRTMEDFRKAFKFRPYGKQARMMYITVCFEIWNSTTCLASMEQEVVAILGLECVPWLCDGSKITTNRSTGSVKSLGNRVKKTLCNDNMR